jgi:hypothetical protein
MRTTPAVAEYFTKVKTGELEENFARNEVGTLEIEEAYRFEQLVGNVDRYEPGFRVFTWAMDWAFGEETNDDEIPLAVQMSLWEEDARGKISESVHALADDEGGSSGRRFESGSAVRGIETFGSRPTHENGASSRTG